jgi:hypothetical protein
VSSIHESVPFIEGEPPAYKIRPLATGIANQIQGRTFASGKVRESVEGKVLSSGSEVEGTSRTTEVLVDVRWSTGYFHSKDIVTFAEQVAEGFVGRVVSGVGRVQTAEVTNAAHDGAQIELKLVSRTA